MHTPISPNKSFLIFAVTALIGIAAKADVIITMPTGGQNISVDKAVTGVSPAFTNLGDIVIADNVAGDFATGNDLRIRLDRPAGWQFEAGVGVITRGGTNLSAATIAISATEIVITYTVSGAAIAGNSLTISGLRVQPLSTNAALNPIGNVTRSNTASQGAISGFPNGSVVASLSKVATAYTKLQVLLPGQTAAPGTVSGKTGAAAVIVAGTAFNVTVNAVDNYWNVITTASGNTIQLTANTIGSIPIPTTLVAGTITYNIILRQSGTSRSITAIDLTDATITANESSNFTVAVGEFTKLLAILPGETYAAGTLTGKIGNPTSITANTNFTVIVRAVDHNWNTITSATDSVGLTTTDPAGSFATNNVPLVNGVRSFTAARLRAAGNLHTITATYTNDPTKTEYTTAAITVVAGAFAKLVLILPGETEQQGIVAGKTGSPSALTAGTPISVKVNAVDANGNIVNTVTDLVRFTASDAFTTLPANTPLANGTLTATVTYRAAGTNERLTATNVTDGTKTASTSPIFTVVRGAFVKLLVTLPGQIYTPGSPMGNIDAIANQGVNVPFNIVVRAVDDYWNLVNNVTDVISITCSDGAAVLPSNAALVGGVKSDFSVSLNTVGTQAITATNFTDNSKTLSTMGGIVVFGPSSLGDFFRSTVTSGNWNNSSSWESSFDGLNWQPATISPNSASNTVTIRNANTINVEAAVAIDQVIVEVGGVLSVNVNALTVADGTGTDLIVNGTLSNRSAITTAGSIQFSASGRYIHTAVGVGTIPTSVWNAGSICEVRGYTNYAGIVGGSGQLFSDFIWNAPNQTSSSSPSLSGAFTARSFTVLSTGAGAMNFASTGGTVNLTGDFSQSAGRVGINKTNGAATLNIAGNFSLLGGTFRKGNGDATVNFNGIGVQTYVKTAATISGAINFSIGSASTVDFGTSILNGSTGTFTLATGGSLITANASGIATTGNTGSIQVGGTRTYNLGSYTYNGNLAQQSGTGLPLTITNLTIANASGVTLSATSNTYNLDGVLTIDPAAGSLNTGTNILSGAFTNTGAGTLITAAVNPFAAGKTWNVGVAFNSGMAQNIVSGTYNSLLSTAGVGVKTGPSLPLNVAGNWSSAGGDVDLATNATPISFNGSGSQSISASNLFFQNVTFANGGTKTLSNGVFNVSATGTLTMAGSATLNANGNLMLLSNASSSARVASIPSGAAITGNVTVQRFITGGPKNPYRTWRMLSSPVAGFSFNQLIDDIFITGTGGAANGFDFTPGAASAYVYNNGFAAVTHINQTVVPGKGIYLAYRGDRSNAAGKLTTFATAVNPESSVIDFTGSLNQGDVTVPLSSGGLNLLGNPYASSINWTLINKTGLANSTIWVWNPANRNYAVYDDGSISGAIALNGSSPLIPSGQSFFASSGTSLTFTESAKDGGQPANLLLSTPVNNAGLQLLQASASKTYGKTMTGGATTIASPSPSVKLKLTKDLTTFSDEINLTMKAGNSANFVANEDILTFGAAEVALSSLSFDGRRVAANRLPELSGTSEVKLSIGGEEASRTGNFKLNLNYSDLPVGYIVQIKDKFTNTTTALPNGGNYAFSMDKDVATTFGQDRLSVSFVPPTTLPVKITSFSATKSIEGLVLKWATSTETDNVGFEIKRAGEDKVFKSILTAKAKGPSSYLLIDKNPLMGNNYYKLKQIDKDGTSAFHDKIAMVNFDGINQADLIVYPNPVTDKFTVRYSGVLAGEKQIIKIISATGQVLLTKTVARTDLNIGVEIYIAGYVAGVYLVDVIDAESNTQIDLGKLIKL